MATTRKPPSIDSEEPWWKAPPDKIQERMMADFWKQQQRQQAKQKAHEDQLAKLEASTNLLDAATTATDWGTFMTAISMVVVILAKKPSVRLLALALAVVGTVWTGDTHGWWHLYLTTFFGNVPPQ